MLHRNLVYLATIADSNQNMQSLLPAVSIRLLCTFQISLFATVTLTYHPNIKTVNFE